MIHNAIYNNRNNRNNRNNLNTHNTHNDHNNHNDRLPRLIRLLDVYISQYEDTVQQALACNSEITRIRSMIDTIVNDIREIPSADGYVPQVNPIHFPNTGFVHTPDIRGYGPNYNDSGYNRGSGHGYGHGRTFVNYTTTTQTVVDASLNHIAPENIAGFFDNVEVVPSREQITNAVTIYAEFSHITNPINDICPISLKPFESNDPVSQIDYCNHIFCRNELSEWFTHNVRCPVCRHDIRDAQGLEEEMNYNNESKEELPQLEPIGSNWF